MKVQYKPFKRAVFGFCLDCIMSYREERPCACGKPMTLK